MKARVLFLICVFPLWAYSSISAQRLRSHSLPEKGIEIKVPQFMKLVPTKAADRLTLAKFAGKTKAKVAGNKGDWELTYLIFRIDKRKVKAKIEGEGDSEGKTSVIPSLNDVMNLKLNSATDVNSYLEARGFESDLAENTKLHKRPLRNAKKEPYRIYDRAEVAWNVRGVRERITESRAYLIDSDSQILGLVVIGLAQDAFADAVQKSVKSLKLTAAVARTENSVSEDLYANSDLRDIEKRRAVRARLVVGWQAHDTEDFILVTNVRKKKLVKDLLTDLKIMREAYIDRFPPIKEIEAVSTVRVCDGYDDYLRYAGMGARGSGGYWSFREEELVLFNPERKIPEAREWIGKIDTMATLYHEAMHQYSYYANGRLAPGSWFGEGYGEYFGGAKVDRRKGLVKEYKRNKFRMDWIRRAKKERAWPDLPAFLKISRSKFYSGGPLQNYAFAWAFCYFLELEGKKKPAVRNNAWAAIPDNYLIHLRRITQRHREELSDQISSDWLVSLEEEIQEEAYQATFGGVDMIALEKAWIKEMKRWK